VPKRDEPSIRNDIDAFPGRSAAAKPTRSVGFGGALQTRDRSTFGAWNDPGSAAHRCALHRVREKHQGVGARTEAGDCGL
jgi:hypothetical protein